MAGAGSGPSGVPLLTLQVFDRHRRLSGLVARARSVQADTLWYAMPRMYRTSSLWDSRTLMSSSFYQALFGTVGSAERQGGRGIWRPPRVAPGFSHFGWRRGNLQPGADITTSLDHPMKADEAISDV